MVVPRFYEDLNVMHHKTMPARTYYIPASVRMNDLVEHRERSDRFQLLNGEWKFQYYNSIYDVTESFYEKGYDVSGFDQVTVPGVWQMDGYDTHQYTNIRYPFPFDPPYVPQDIPCGAYVHNSYYQDLPENWQFTSLREITTSLTLNDGDWILSQNMSNIGDVKLLQLGSIGNMVYIDKGFKYLTKDIFKELSCTEIFSGYLLINRIISDKMCCCIVPDIDGTIITTVDTCWIAPSNTSYDIKFLMYQLASPTFQKEVLLKASGTTRRRISKNNLINIALLLPPLAEQKRIVTAIEEAFSKLDKISEALA